jgi:hypothetical protein
VRNACNILVGIPEGMRPGGRLGLRMDLREMGWDGNVDWVHLAEG